MVALPTRIGSDGVARRGLGGSDAAAALGVHPYKPPIQLWLEVTGRISGKVENPAMYWGTKLEPTVRQEYCDRHRCSIEVPREPMYHPEKEWARGTPDGFVLAADGATRERGYEGKCAGLRVAHRWGETGTDEVPIEYVVQSLWYMWITALSRWDIAVLVGGNDYREYTIHHSADVIAGLVDGAERFWVDHVLADIPPEPDDSDDYRRFLADRYPNSSGEIRKATAEEMEIIARYQDAVVTAHAADKAKKRAEAEVMAVIGEDRGIDAGDLGRITRTVRRGNPQYKQIAMSAFALGGASPNQFDAIADENRGAPSVSLNRPKKWTSK